MATFRWIISLALLAVLSVFAYKNFYPVSIDYYFDTARLPLAVLLLLMVLLGSVATSLVGLAEQVRLQARIRGLRRRVGELEKELAGLRGTSAHGRDEGMGGADETESDGEA